MVALWMLVGCAGESGGGGDTASAERDTGESQPDIEVSDTCKRACGNFMDKCGDRTPVTRSDCEFDCEKDWSTALANCIQVSPTCIGIERCADQGAADTGTSGDAGETEDAGADLEDVGTPDGDASDGGETAG